LPSVHVKPTETAGLRYPATVCVGEFLVSSPTFLTLATLALADHELSGPVPARPFWFGTNSCAPLLDEAVGVA
jgi:hypothetical protein